MSTGDVVIAAYGRSPFGRFFGGLKDLPASRLGALTVDALLARTGIAPESVDALYAGVGMAAGGSFTPARELVLHSRLPDATPSMAVDRACCSGLTAIALGFNALRTSDQRLVICGGFENLSRTPLWAERQHKSRPGDPAARDPSGPIYDPLLLRSPMAGKAIAEYTGEEALAAGVSRTEQDHWALGSHQRALAAEARGFFAGEILPVGALLRDEGPRPDTSLQALAALPTLYQSPTITAGNAPGLSDGAAFLVVATRGAALAAGLEPVARILDTVSLADGPTSGSYTPALAIRRLLERRRWTTTDLDLIEINEAYAATPLVSTLRLADGNASRARELRQRVNVNGGAVALGHPLGASGARIVMTLASALRARGGGRGAAAICGGYGQGEGLLLEVPG